MEATASIAWQYAPPILTAPPWEDPELLAQQVISGIASGSLFAILALAIVLIYRSTSVLNFAQGEMAMFSTFIAWTFMTRMDFWLAFLLAILVAAAIGAALERLVLRPVERAAPLNSLIVTLGLFTGFNGLALWIWGPLPKGFGPFSLFEGFPLIGGALESAFPFFRGSAYCVSDVCIGRLNVGVLIVATIVMAGLYLLFQRTRVGLAMRATAQNPLASQLAGIPVGNMLTLGWGLSAGVGAIAGVLVAQSVSLTTGSLFVILLYAFAAAVLGGLDSPVGAVVGGLTIGVTKNLAATYVPSEVGNVDVAIAFAVIVVVLMIRPAGLFGRPPPRRV
ncbi:MAG: branched-chain amino acid ABC transporter permease [Chloroflexi bacterium]|nr:branched-chain amino acid ABC transporter permease [Chloroflexota bacterium]